MTTNMGPLKVGDRVGGKYEIRGLLGKGGHAFVYDAFNLVFDEEVAIKVILNRPHHGPQRFDHKEAKALRRMSHPNIVAVLDAGEINGMAYIVMEKLDGMDLRKLTQQIGPLTVLEALKIASQVAKALVAAHAIGVIHRDLKPENIFLVAGNHVKVVDFGIAKVLERGYPTTQRDLIQGTVAYMSPEQAQAFGVTFASDVFQLCVIIYEMIAGICPCMVGVEEATHQVLIARQISKMPPRLKELVPAVPDYVDRIVWRGLAKEPWQRYPSSDAQRDRDELVLTGVMTEFAVAIDRAIDRLGVELPPEHRGIRAVRGTPGRDLDLARRSGSVPEPRTTPIALATSNAAGTPAVGPMGTEVIAKPGYGHVAASQLGSLPSVRSKTSRTASQQAVRMLFARAALIGSAVALPAGLALWFTRAHARPTSEVTPTISERPAPPVAAAPAQNEPQSLAAPAPASAAVLEPLPRVTPDLSWQPPLPAPANRSPVGPALASRKPVAKSALDELSAARESEWLGSNPPKPPKPAAVRPSPPKPVSAAESNKVKLIF